MNQPHVSRLRVGDRKDDIPDTILTQYGSEALNARLRVIFPLAGDFGNSCDVLLPSGKQTPTNNVRQVGGICRLSRWAPVAFF